MKKEFEGITKDGQPLEIYIRDEENDEIEQVRNRDIRDRTRGTNYSYPTGKFVGNTSGARSERGDLAKTDLSCEVKAHLNYLNQKGGIEAVHEFLNKPKEPMGSIESALKDADEKISFFAKEAERLTKECHKWMAVRNQLLQAQDILKGKVSVGSSVESEGGNQNGKQPLTKKQRHWPAFVRELLKDGETMRKEDFINKMGERHPELRRQTLYSAAYTLKMKGIIDEADGLVALAKS